MKSVVIKVLQIFSTIYAFVYFKGFALPVINGQHTDDAFENISVLSMCIFFCLAVAVSWFRVKMGGLLIMLWFAGITVLCFNFWTDAGMAFVLSIPMFLVGIAMIFLDLKIKVPGN